LEIVTTIAPLALIVIMFTLGLGLSLNDFIRVVKFPKDFIIGFLCQLILLPIIAILIILLIDLPTPIAVGLMIIAAAPGGVTSNVLTKFANGDVALSISLTAVISLLSIVSVPFVVINSANYLGASISSEISMTGIALKMATVVTIPVIFGMVIRKFFENFVLSKMNIINKISGWLFLIIFLAIYIEERNNIFNFIAQAGLAVLILNITMMISAYLIAKKFASGEAQKRCIALEGGLQNGVLAVFVSTFIFSDPVYVIPTGAYALTMYITGFIFIYFLRRSNKTL
jgi:BASS family bile acid:Na+ symporter